MQFLVYSDIHHDDYNNGITEADVVAVEDQVTQYAVQNQIQYVFFLGDWYRATNPNRSVIAVAEESWKRRSDAGITTIVLVGNHDRWTKSAESGHAFVSAGIYKTDLRNIQVIEDIREFDLEDVHFLCIPSGYERHSTIVNYNRSRDCTLIVLFHGLVAGSALANGGSAGSGIHPDVLRSLEADLIIGGDNHTHQRLDDLLNCVSLYVGAPLQHNWGDRGQTRGFWYINQCVGYTPEIRFIPSCSPRFVRKKLEAINDLDAITKVSALLDIELGGNKGIVEVTFMGKYAASLDADLIENTISQLGSRRQRVIIDRVYEKTQIAGVAEAIQPEDKWNAHVAGTNTKELNPVLLSEMGKWAIQEARSIL